MKISMKIMGVKIGRAPRFYGLAFVQRHKGSIIEIGDNATFRSKPASNALGINHRCILTAEKNAKLLVGDNIGMSGGSIWCFKHIKIDKNVRIGANTLITDGDAHSDDPRSGESKPVHICENVWLGMNVTVLKGVTIGKNTLIGAGSVVTKDIPENVVAAGNPCKVVKQLDQSIVGKLET